MATEPEFSCNCEGGDGYNEDPYQCNNCFRVHAMEQDGRAGVIKLYGHEPCPMCGTEAVCWRRGKTYGMGCFDIENCGVSLDGFLSIPPLSKAWNRRVQKP